MGKLISRSEPIITLRPLRFLRRLWQEGSHLNRRKTKMSQRKLGRLLDNGDVILAKDLDPEKLAEYGFKYVPDVRRKLVGIKEDAPKKSVTPRATSETYSGQATIDHVLREIVLNIDFTDDDGNPCVVEGDLSDVALILELGEDQFRPVEISEIQLIDQDSEVLTLEILEDGGDFLLVSGKYGDLELDGSGTWTYTPHSESQPILVHKGRGFYEVMNEGLIMEVVPVRGKKKAEAWMKDNYA